MSNFDCQKLRAEYENLKNLKQEFDSEYQKAVETGNLEKVQELKDLLEQKRDALKHKLEVWKWKQYDRRTLESVEYKENYAVVESLEGHQGAVRTLQVLPDGRIVFQEVEIKLSKSGAKRHQENGNVRLLKDIRAG